MPPLNRPNPLFEILSGVVDTDTYRSQIHLPFFMTAQDGLYEIEKGTPIAQIVAFRRSEMILDVRSETAEEADNRERILRNTRAGAAWYRQNARAKRG